MQLLVVIQMLLRVEVLPAIGPGAGVRAWWSVLCVSELLVAGEVVFAAKRLSAAFMLAGKGPIAGVNSYMGI
jgi:hypothetical protein